MMEDKKTELGPAVLSSARFPQHCTRSPNDVKIKKNPN